MKISSSFHVLIFLAGMGMFLSTFDSGVMNLVIPYLVQHLNQPLHWVAWVITGYSISLSCSILIFGKLADKFGKLRIYRLGILLFGVSSLICGFSHWLWILIFARISQGLGAAMIQATSIPIALNIVSAEKRPQALGYLGIFIGLGPMLGPSLGGFILSALGWPWVFFLNIPLCILIYIFSPKLASHEDLHDEPINYQTLSLFALTLFSFLICLNFYTHEWESIPCLSLLIFLTFWIVQRERYSPHPLLPKTLYLNPEFSVPIFGSFVLGMATMICFLVPPIYFQFFQNLPPWKIGLISLPGPTALVITARFAGAQIKTYGSKNLMLTGFFCMTLATLALSFMSLNWRWPEFIPCLMLYGMGAGIFQTPSIHHILQETPSNQHATASSCIRMIQNAGIGIGAMLVGVLIQRSLNTQKIPIKGIIDTWYCSLALLLITEYLLYRYLKKPLSTHFIKQK